MAHLDQALSIHRLRTGPPHDDRAMLDAYRRVKAVIKQTYLTCLSRNGMFHPSNDDLQDILSLNLAAPFLVHTSYITTVRGN